MTEFYENICSPPLFNFQAVKLHPETQYFGNYTTGNLGDFYPVIETQLEEGKYSQFTVPILNSKL